MIEQEKIEEIKNKTDIVAVIGQYVQLKKVGKNYRALCPFHSEKDPSFYVVPEKGIYYCFGCKRGGNVIKFLMEYEKLDFPTAVKNLAKELGIEIDSTHDLKYKELYEVNELACQFFSLCLNKEIGKRGREYIKSRKLNLDVLKEFRIGYAPVSGGLITFMRQKGISRENLIKAGLISRTGVRRGANAESFRDRIIFPIYNLSGRIIGFGGRGVDEYLKPKYLNSPETPIFKKGNVLYGLYNSKESIKQKNEAIIVEGYFDLLSLFQKGIKNICAPLGTSLTEEQCFLIGRFAKKVNILFDGDVSGIKAALRAIGMLINAQVDVFITQLPDDTDPDTFINKKGPDELRQMIEQAQDFFHFYRKVVKTQSIEEEVGLIKDLIKIISRISDPIRFDRYLKYAARIFNIPVDTIKKEMNKRQIIERKTKSIPKFTAEERMMAMILNTPENFNFAKEILTADDFCTPGLVKLFKTLLKNQKFDVAEFSDINLIDQQLKEKLLYLIIKELPVSKEAFKEAILRYKWSIDEKKIKDKISKAQAAGNEKECLKYQQELNTLKRKMLHIEMNATQ